MAATSQQPSVLEWGWAGSALELESGDLHVVIPFQEGALVALIDGLGHGPEAAAASQAAAALLEERAGDPVLALVERCHQGLRKTRGVAMSLASFNAHNSSVTWTGVGNVDSVLLRSGLQGRAATAILLRGGVVGYHLPPLRADTVSVSPGDILVMATDGIRDGFTDGLRVDGPPGDIAESILARFSKGSDDAHVVVARYLGASS